jgi:hypothetical protein
MLREIFGPDGDEVAGDWRKLHTFTHHPMILRKVKAIPVTGLERPWGFQEVQAPRFQDNRRHMKVVRLSAPCTGRLYLKEVFPVRG